MKKSNLVLGFLFALGLAVPTMIAKTECKAPRDTTVYVKLDDVYGESEEAREYVRHEFFNNLKGVVGLNYRKEESFDLLGNLFSIKVNSESIENIRKIPNVDYALKEKMYYPQQYCGELGAYDPDKTEIAPEENYTRVEFHVPENTNEGKGSFVAILDNGFVINHDAMTNISDSDARLKRSDIEALMPEMLRGHGRYLNNKVVFYYDYAMNNNEVYHAGLNHGVHVSSLAGGNGETYKGIAPKAQMALMKVFPDNGGGAADATVLKALQDCIKLKVDVLNMSLGMGNADFMEEESATMKAFDDLYKQGTIASVSAGNDGKGEYLKDSVQTNDYGVYGNNAVDNVEPGILGSYANMQTPVIVASTVLPQDTKLQKAGSYCQKVSGFSSEGATFDLSLKPDIASPGSNIWGADIPDDKHNYVYMSGTSMAAPNYTGAIASIIGEQNFADENERVEFVKSLPMRTMSTANILYQSTGAAFTPRKQGAGQVDVGRAIASKIYLEGSANKAKIELKNNSEIAVGHINFDVKTHSAAENDVAFDAKLLVQSPALVAYEDVDNMLASLNDKLLETVDLGQVTIHPGEGSFNVDYTINDASKDYLNFFRNGTYLEGFLTLTPKDDNATALNMPYLGFYGDYGNPDSVIEEFDHLKDPNLVYNNVVLNSFFKAYYKKQSTNFSSLIIGASSNLSSSQISSVMKNDADINSLGNVLMKEGDTIIAGIDGLSNTLIIQADVLRSVISSSFNLVSSETGETVYSSALQAYNGTATEGTNGQLRKSLIISESEGGVSYSAVRGFAQFKVAASDGTLLYPAGNYVLKFNYKLAAGYDVTRSIPLIIREGRSEAPYSSSREIIERDGETLLKCYLGGGTITGANANGDELELKEENGKQFVEIKVADYQKKNRVLLEVTNNYNISSRELISLADIDVSSSFFSVTADGLKSTFSITCDVTEGEIKDGKFTNSYSVSIKNANGKSAGISNFILTLKIPNRAIAEKEAISIVDKSGTGESSVDFEFDNGFIRVKTKNGKVDVTYTYKPIPVEGLVINEGDLSLKVGDTKQLTLTFDPVEHDDTVLTWESSDNSIVTVDNNGLVTAVAEGQAKVSVITTEGVTCEINVTVSAVQTEPTQPTQPTEPTKPVNTGLIIGIVGGVVVLAAAAVVIILVLKKKKEVK